MSTLKVLHNYEKKSYAQDKIDLRSEFAFCKVNKNTVEVLHQPVLCRDFLLDTLIWDAGLAKLGNKKVWDEEEEDYVESDGLDDCYGYNFTGPIEKDKSYLYVTNLEGINNLTLLWAYEEELGVTLTKVLKTNEKSCYVLVGDPKYQEHTVYHSLWTLMIRHLLTLPEPEKTISVSPKKKVSILALIQDVKNYKFTSLEGAILEKKDPEDYHHYNGIISFHFRSINTIFFET